MEPLEVGKEYGDLLPLALQRTLPLFHRFHHFHDGQFFVGVGVGLVAAPY
jgi:hypothetical protein